MNDDLAVISEPNELQPLINSEVNDADLFLNKLNSNSSNLFDSKKQNSCRDQVVRKMMIYNIESDLNAQVYKDTNPELDINSNSNIDMPSGLIFQTLCDEYKFYTNTIDFQLAPNVLKNDYNQEKTLCQMNAEIAMEFNMTEVSFSWL